MNELRSLVIAVLLCSIGGCASQVVEPDASTTSKPTVKALESFSIELSPKAREQFADNDRFNIKALEATLDRILRNKGLIATDGDFRLKVVVSDIRVRGTFNAVMWGFMAGDDHLNGDSILFRKEAEDPVYQFKVRTSYALGGFAGGQDAMRMDWLYEEFSNRIANKLVALREAKK